MTFRRKLLALGAAGLLVLVVAAGGLWWFLRDDAPDPVDLTTAVASSGAVRGIAASSADREA